MRRGDKVVNLSRYAIRHWLLLALPGLVTATCPLAADDTNQRGTITDPGTGQVVGRGPGLNITRDAPLIIILDIDGTRQDFLYEMLYTGELPNMSRIVGRPLSGSARAKIPYENHNTDRALDFLEFENSIALLKSTSVFPSFTFCAQASIFTGEPPSVHGILGNDFLDRNGKPPRMYAFTGSEVGVPWGDAMAAYSEGLADQTLRCKTVYQRIGERAARAAVVFNMYKSGASWLPIGISPGISMETLREYLVYYREAWTYNFDQLMMTRATERLAEWVTEAKRGEGGARPWVLTLYFAGLDHRGHAFGTGDHKQYLREVVDPEMGKLMEHLADWGLLGRTTFIITSDHGQTDTGKGGDHYISQRIAGDYFIEQGEVNPKAYYSCAPGCQTEVANSAIVFGLNGGMAHVYLSANRRPGDWGRPANWEQVQFMAATISRNAKAGIRLGWTVEVPWMGSIEGSDLTKYTDTLDMILLRRPSEPGAPQNPYEVYVDIGPYVQAMELGAFLRSLPGQEMLQRWGWRLPDAAQLVEKRIQEMNCDRSGDIVLVPRYPDYYMEHGRYPGEHGSILPTDMYVPFILARPPAQGFSGNQMYFKQELLDALQMSLRDRQFPSIMDTSRVAATLCKTMWTPDTVTVPTPPPPRIEVGGGQTGALRREAELDAPGVPAPIGAPGGVEAVVGSWQAPPHVDGLQTLVTITHENGVWDAWGAALRPNDETGTFWVGEAFEEAGGTLRFGCTYMEAPGDALPPPATAEARVEGDALLLTIRGEGATRTTRLGRTDEPVALPVEPQADAPGDVAITVTRPEAPTDQQPAGAAQALLGQWEPVADANGLLEVLNVAYEDGRWDIWGVQLGTDEAPVSFWVAEECEQADGVLRFRCTYMHGPGHTPPPPVSAEARAEGEDLVLTTAGEGKATTRRYRRAAQ